MALRFGSRKVAAVLVACAALLLVSLPASAETPIPTDSLQIREGDPLANYTVKFDVPEGQMILYGNGENCGDSSHRTIKAEPRRYYSHFHITYTLPKTGTDQYGNPRTVNNTDEINAYWDTRYPSPNYTRYLDADHTYNCYGYALWTEVWVQDPSWIYADDYDTTTSYEDENIDCLAGHVIFIRYVWDVCNGKIKRTRQKNRESGRYYRAYASPGIEATATMRKSK